MQNIEGDYKKCGSGCAKTQDERTVNFGYCAGSISKCSNAGGLTDIASARVVDDDSRLYSGYSVASTSYGEVGGPGKTALVNPI